MQLTPFWKSRRPRVFGATHHNNNKDTDSNNNNNNNNKYRNTNANTHAKTTATGLWKGISPALRGTKMSVSKSKTTQVF